jgi:hypothetical protein
MTVLARGDGMQAPKEPNRLRRPVLVSFDNTVANR